MHWTADTEQREQLIVEPPPLDCVKCEDLSEWVGTWAECHIQGDLMHPPPRGLDCLIFVHWEAPPPR